jgi:uncharacterized membrane protein YGL010W
MLGGKSNDQWVSEYSQSHQNPINRVCHTIGIPLIAGSILLFLVSIVIDVFVLSTFVEMIWPYALGAFVLGWVLQFVGHFAEGKPPEFLRDWRFLFVGLRWWFAKVRGRA